MLTLGDMFGWMIQLLRELGVYTSFSLFLQASLILVATAVLFRVFSRG